MTTMHSRSYARKLRRRSRRDIEEGASLVEFAMILPLFVVLLFALIDFGLVFGGFISIENEVNSAARAVSIGNLSSGCSTNANPDLCTIVVRISETQLGVVANSVEVALEFPNSGTDTADNPVIVCAQATVKSTTGMTSSLVGSKTVYSSSEILLEQPAAVGSVAPTAPSYSYSNTAGFTCH